jgi:hypothetical protein
MTRGLVLTAALLLAGTSPAFAQVHPPSHVRPPGPHHGDHTPLDSAAHAAMHALLHGSWTGTLTQKGASSRFALTVGQDSLRKVTFAIQAAEPLRIGAATDLAMAGDRLEWTQSVSGRPCRATAVLSGATPGSPEAMKGTLACPQGDLTFAVRKKTG